MPKIMKESDNLSSFIWKDLPCDALSFVHERFFAKEMSREEYINIYFKNIIPNFKHEADQLFEEGKKQALSEGTFPEALNRVWTRKVIKKRDEILRSKKNVSPRPTKIKDEKKQCPILSHQIQQNRSEMIKLLSLYNPLDQVNELTVNSNKRDGLSEKVAIDSEKNYHREKLRTKLDKQSKKESRISPQVEIIKREVGVKLEKYITFEVHSDGIIDEKRSQTLNWILKKQKMLVSFYPVEEFILVNDIYRLVASKNWINNKKMEAEEVAGWLALTAIPVNKLSKILNAIKAAQRLLKDVNLTEEELQILNSSKYFENHK